MAPVIRAISDAEDMEHVLVVTGQHRELLDSALNDLELTPAHDMNLMTPNQVATGLVAAALSGCGDLFRKIRPDLVLVHGDTGSACAAALAAFLERLPVGHVEAGLRSGSLNQPFPEEGNRRVVDTISQLLWAPTEQAAEQLYSEGLRDRRITVTGNTAIDALLQSLDRARAVPWEDLPGLPEDAELVLVTAHRRESFGEPFRTLCRGLLGIVEGNSRIHIVYPVHLNPNVRGPVLELLGGHSRIHLLPPLSYLPFLALMDRSRVVLTDSGGLQEEAPALNKPVLVMRERTERQEGLAAGTIRLVGTKAEVITRETLHLIEDEQAHRAMAEAVNPFGDGRASERILADIRDFVGLG
jgi:UDP-N-acetylglucosamine 2-epimerase (non-hydrolysing)